LHCKSNVLNEKTIKKSKTEKQKNKLKMKKIFTLLTACTFALGTNAQDDQKFQMGLATSVGMNFNKSGSKLLSRDGVGSDIMIGLNVQYNFTPTISLLTGIEFEFEKFKYKYPNGDRFYYFDGDSKIYSKSQIADVTGERLFRVSQRTQKPVIIYLPTMMTFRTSEIGALRYFGRFGLRSGIVVKSSVTDKGALYNLDEVTPEIPAATNPKMQSTKDLFAFRSYVGIAGGAMWNFSGSTTLVGEIGYYYGLTPIHSGKAIFGKDDSKNQSLFTRTAGVDTYYQPKATQGQLVLKISILF
jgi:hypothetical protein